MAPLKEITAGGVDLIQPMPYTSFQSMIDEFAPPGWLNYHRGQHIAFLTDSILDDYLEVGRSIGSPMTQGIIFRNGGAISQVAEDRPLPATAARRTWRTRSPAGRTRRTPTARSSGSHRFSAAFEPALTGGVYLNFEPDTPRPRYAPGSATASTTGWPR